MARKKRKMTSNNNTMWVVILILVAVVGMMFGSNFFGSVADTPSSLRDAELASATLTCPTDGDTSLTIDVRNILNTTGTEGFDATVYVLAEDGSIVTSITDTTNPTAATVTCGFKYALAVVRADGENGDNSQVQSILAKPSGSNAVVEGGQVYFTADRSNMGLTLGVEQHGVLQFRVYDNVDARFAYDTGDTDNTAFEADGTTFTDGDNSTAFAVGSGGYIDFRIDMQSTGTDTNANDAYMLVAVEAPVNIWDEPTIKFENTVLSDVKTSALSANELIGLTDYEYVYKIDAKLLDDVYSMDFYMKALAGADPTADVQIDFFPAGNFLKTDGTGIMTGSHVDDSAKTAVFTTQDVTVDIS